MSLKVINLSKRFNGKWVLRDVSFEVSAGEVFGIIGGLGSGKTALLGAIAGLIKPDGGEISNGRLPAQLYSPSSGSGTPIWGRLFGPRQSFSGAGTMHDLVARLENADGVLL